MPYKPSFGTLQSAGEPLEPPKQGSPFRIAVLADFSGRQNRGVTGNSADIAARRLVRVSRDNLDEVMGKLGVELKLPVGDTGETATLSFASLDDFHPDQLHDRVEPVADAYDSEEKSALLNSVVHHPDFQALESAWRGLAWMLGRAAKGTKVEVLLLDISLAELAADLKASDNLATSGLHQLLIDKWVRGTQGEPWGLLVGNYDFDLTGQHAELLGRIAKIASQTNAPFLTTVHPRVLEKSFTIGADDAPAWHDLRMLPESVHLGLSVPRFLMRIPYGENTKSIDKFSYEEMSNPPDRARYLWGNPALACAVLLAQSFHREGWGCQAGTVVDLDDLPMHVYTVDGEPEVTLGEAWLVRPQTEQLVKMGLMPFLCVRGQAAMQLLRFLSLAVPVPDDPPCALVGRWVDSGVEPAPQVAGVSASVGMVGAIPEKPRKGEAPPPPLAALKKEIPPSGRPASSAAQPAPAAKPAPKPAAAAPAPKPAAPAASAPPAPKPAPAAAPKPPPAPEPEAAPEEEELDPELAALLKQLE